MTSDPFTPLEVRASRIRWAVVSVCVAMSVVLYLDRVCVSIAERYIADELQLTAGQMGLFYGSFFWIYALAQVPSGWMSEQFGARRMLTIYIAAWSVMTICLGLAQGLIALVLFRGLMGLAQAGAYPTSGTLLSRWIPFPNRGLASAAVALGGRLGGALAPLLTTYCIVAFVPPAESSLLSVETLKSPEKFVAVIQAPPPGDKPEQISRREALAQLRLWLSDEQLADLSSPDRERREKGIQAINRILTEETFFQPHWLSTLPFEREARRLGKRESGSWTPAEKQRLNRLTLEAVQPDSLRKVYEQGWRPTLMLYGGVGIAIALLYWIVARDWPVQHPWCNSAERELIAEQTLARPVSDSSGKSPSVPFPWRAVLTSQSLWLMSIMQFGTNIGWVFLITSLPAYLSEVHKVPLAERGWMQTIPLTMGILGTFVGGHLTDWLVGRLGLRWGRMAQVMVTRLFCVLAFAACPFLTDPWAVTIAMSIVAFSVDLGVAPTWAFMQDVGGRSAGSILGWANMWGNLGAAVSPMLISLVLEQTNRNWTAVFALCAAGFVMALICGFGVDARKPIAPPA